MDCNVWLVFDTLESATSALALIDDLMMLPLPGTETWAIPKQRLDGKWCFQKPEIYYMHGVANYTEENYCTDWYPVEGE